MYKLFLTVFVIGLSFAAAAEFIPYNYYSIVSDDFSDDVKPGNCIVKGKIIDTNGKPIVGGTVANFSRSQSCMSDASGNYALTLSSKDTALFFYHENYGEIIIWKYEFKSQHIVVINFYSMEESEIPVEVEKPVIYLYSEENMSFSLSVSHPNLTFTYPKMNASWNLTATASGDLISETNKTYPYLFWEGEQNNLAYECKENLVSGFFIATDSTIEFLENALSQLGLNDKESADFITYWGPRMIKQKYAFVQFLVDEDYENRISEIDITPLPDSQRRVYMLFTPLDFENLPFDYQKQILPSFERTGFSLIEWGGSELNQIPISL